MQQNIEIRIFQRYFSRLNAFLSIKSFENSQSIVRSIFSREKISFNNRTQYINFIIKLCIEDYEKNIGKEIIYLIKMNKFSEVAKIENAAYNECIKVNPFLDINKIWILQETRRTSLAYGNINELKQAENISNTNLENNLKKYIIGQEDAIQKISQAIKRSTAGLKMPEKPIASFMFLGKTGVGKTQLAKTLAFKHFGDEKMLVRVDCSEFSHSHETAKLLGAPPGYVGHDKNGESFLFTQTKNKKSFVFLLDEIEKSNISLHQLLLQILDEGFIRDSYGKKILFNNSVIIMTSNIGSRELSQDENRIGFGKGGNETSVNLICQSALKKKFSPEFINRIDEILVFKSLSIDSLVKIFDIILEEYALLLMNKEIDLVWNNKVAKFIISKSSYKEYGARDLKRLIIKEIIDPLSTMIVQKECGPGTKVEISIDKSKLSWQVSEDAEFQNNK